MDKKIPTLSLCYASSRYIYRVVLTFNEIQTFLYKNTAILFFNIIPNTDTGPQARMHQMFHVTSRKPLDLNLFQEKSPHF